MLAGDRPLDGAHGRGLLLRPDRAGRRDGHGRLQGRSSPPTPARSPTGSPVVGLWHSGGARLREGVGSLHAVGEVFAIMTRASGVIPQISVVLGAAAGGAAYGPALTDIVDHGTGGSRLRHRSRRRALGHRRGRRHAAPRRPRAARAAQPASSTSPTDTERGALDAARALVGPARPAGRASDRSTTSTSAACCPTRTSAPTTCTRWSRACSTQGTGVELHARWAPNIMTTLGRLGGRTVGVVANNPLRLGRLPRLGVRREGARFVRMCDALGVPLVVLVDVPGYLPGVGQEWDGVVRRGAPSCCTPLPSASCRG